MRYFKDRFIQSTVEIKSTSKAAWSFHPEIRMSDWAFYSEFSVANNGFYDEISVIHWGLYNKIKSTSKAV